MSNGQMKPGDVCLTGPDGTTHDGCDHPEGATLWLGGDAWAHPKPQGTTALTRLDALHTYPGNPRRGDQDEITASIRTLGFYGALQVQTGHGHILVGNHRYRALEALGALLAPTDLLAVSDTVAAALVARDNYTSDQATNDTDDLRTLLEQLEAAEALPLVGGLADELAALRALEAAGQEPPRGPSLADRFLVPPFSVLDARSGVWLARKRQWLDLGIVSEVGRDSALLGGALPAGGQGTSMTKVMTSGATRARSGAYGAKATTQPDGSLSYDVTVGATSIFDPVVCELTYRWFSKAGDTVLDPFAGGSVRGVVAGALQRQYDGIELRAEQVDADQQQWETIKHRVGGEALAPRWSQGDAREVLAQPATELVRSEYDLLFSCPPYADLEVYSDDPADLSAMEWPAFCEAYRAIIAASAARLRKDRFAVWVVGEVRDPRGVYRNLVGETVQAFEAAGLRYYNEAVLVTPAGSLPVRAGKLFTATRKLGKSHQQVLVFLKGDPKKATEHCGQVEVAWPEGWDVEQ